MDDTDKRIRRLENLVNRLWAAVCCLQQKKKTPSANVKSGFISASPVHMLQVLPAPFGKHKGFDATVQYTNARDIAAPFGKHKGFDAVVIHSQTPDIPAQFAKTKGFDAATTWQGTPTVFPQMRKTKGFDAAIAYAGSRQLYAGSGVNVALAGNAWVNPGNCVGNTGGASFADCPLSLTTTPSDYLVATGFSFAVPAGATIVGVQLDFLASGGAVGSLPLDSQILLAYLGTTIGVEQASGQSIGGLGWNPFTYGGASNVWGATLTPAVVNDPTFGVALSIANPNPTDVTDSEISSVALTIFYTQ